MAEADLRPAQSAVRLDVADAGMVLVAQQHARRVAHIAGLDDAGAEHAALAAAELAGNAQRHGSGGQLVLQPAGDVAAVDVVVSDHGPGVDDWTLSSTNGYSTTLRSLGSGLGAVSRVATTISVCSEPGVGTVVSARIGPLGDAVTVGAVGAPRRGERVNGDAWSWSTDDGGVFAVLADGLGHGPDAATAGARAVADPADLAELELPAALLRVHERLRGSRGAAVTVVRLRPAGDGTGHELVVAGVGNVAAAVVAPDGTVRRTLIGHGTAGMAMRSAPQQTTTVVPAGGVVVLHTDGLLGSWDLRGRERLVAAAPAVLAATLLRDHARGRDDTGVLVLRPGRRSGVTELLRLPLAADGDVVKVRASVRQAGRMLGLSGQDQTRLATAAAEVARSTSASGGGTMRLSVQASVEAGSGSSQLLSVAFTPTAGTGSSGHHASLDVLERLLDRFESQPDGWLLGKLLPGDPAVSPSRLDDVRRALEQDTDVDPVLVLHEQNSELATTLAELRNRESELVRLNDELAETNRGVLALYSELERSAERVRTAQREVFTELENALRPPPPSLPGIELAVRYLPAQSNSPTGGDLYDWLVLPDGHLHVSVVDVVGHGVASTRTALDVTHALRTLSREGHALGDLIAVADSLLAGTGSLATVVLARLRLDTGEAEIAGGGHPPVLLVPATGDVRYLEARGRPIGFPGAGSHGTTRFRLGPGDALVLYTDGVIEARNDIDEGLATLRAAGCRLRAELLDDVLDGMLRTARGDAGLRDDALLLGLRRHPDTLVRSS